MIRHIWSRIGVVLLLSVGTYASATDVTKISPALEINPDSILFRLSLPGCVERGFLTPRDPLDHVDAWFREFRSPAYSTLLSRVQGARPRRWQDALSRARTRIREIRRLVDFRTEQALIAMIDAAVRNGKNDAACHDTAARLLLRIAAQRDRAWAWADTMERLLAMNKEKWETELHSRRVADSLRRLEQSYRALERHVR